MKKGSKITDYTILKKRAIALREKGMTQQSIAEVLGVGQTTVNTWLKRYKAEGASYLLPAKMGKGKKPFLGKAELKKLAVLLVEKTAEDYGFEGNFWTYFRISVLIKEEFAVSYKKRSIGDVLKRIGFSLQKPQKKVTTKIQRK